MAKIRHWKQHFSPDHEFVYRRRLNLGNGAFSAPGMDVDKATVSASKLRSLWRAGFIEIKDWRPLQEVMRDRPAVEPRGQGWYFVHWKGQTHRVRGQEAVDALVSELLAAKAA